MVCFSAIALVYIPFNGNPCMLGAFDQYSVVTMQNDNTKQPPRWFYVLTAVIGISVIQVVQFYGLSLWVGFAAAILVAIILMSAWRMHVNKSK